MTFIFICILALIIILCLYFRSRSIQKLYKSDKKSIEYKRAKITRRWYFRLIIIISVVFAIWVIFLIILLTAGIKMLVKYGEDIYNKYHNQIVQTINNYKDNNNLPKLNSSVSKPSLISNSNYLDLDANSHYFL